MYPAEFKKAVLSSNAQKKVESNGRIYEQDLKVFAKYAEEEIA